MSLLLVFDFQTTLTVSVADNTTTAETTNATQALQVSVTDTAFVSEGSGTGLLFAGGSNGYVSVPYTFPTDAFSVLLWYKTTIGFTGNDGWVFHPNSFQLSRQGINDIQIWAYLNASADFTGNHLQRIGQNGTSLKTDGQWHSRAYLVYVNGSNHGAVDEYEDGVFLSSLGGDHTDGGTIVPSGNVRIGLGYNTAFNGSMDRVVFINRKLTATEITNFHNRYTLPVTLGADWEMDDAHGTSVTDSSGNSNTGSFAGSGTAPIWVTSALLNTGNPTVLETNIINVSDSTATSENVKAALADQINVTEIISASDVRTNLITNPSFETDVVGWGGVRSNTAQDSTTAYVGTSSIQSTQTASGNTGVLYSFSYIVGQTYTMQARTKTTAGFSVVLGAASNGQSSGFTATGGWDLLTWTFTPTVSGSDARIFVAGQASGVVLNVDAVMLQTGTTADTYFDGSISPASWTGTANASTSTYPLYTVATVDQISVSDTAFPYENVGQNFAINGDFENAPTFTAATSTSLRWIDGTATGSTTNDAYRWAFYTDGGTNSAQFDSIISHSGSKSLKLDSTVDGGLNKGPRLEQTLTSNTFTITAADSKYLYLVSPNTQYTLSFWYNTSNIVTSNSQGLKGYYRFYDSNTGTSNGEGDLFSPSYISGTNGWTFFSKTLTTGTNTTFFKLEFMIWSSTGTAWLDDIYFQAVTPKEHVVVSSQFSLTDSSTTSETINMAQAYQIGLSDAVFTVEDVGQNLVQNPGFENAPVFVAAQTSPARWVDGTSTGSSTPNNYGIYANANNSFALQFDNANAHTGSEALKLSTTGVNSYSVGNMNLGNSNSSDVKTYGIHVLPSTAYIYTYWMKTNYVSGSSTGAYSTVREHDINGNFVTRTSGTPIATTTGWTQYTISITTRSNTSYIGFEPQVSGNSGTGTLIMDAWYDDINLVPTTLTGNIQETVAISVSDSTTTTEAITLNDVEIIIDSESTTATETIKLLATNFISASDSSITGENLTFASNNQIVLSDNTTTSEAVSLQVTNYINTSDASTTTEAVSLLLVSFITTSDAIATIESTTLTELTFVNTSDSTATNETISITFVELVSVSDSIAASETIRINIIAAITTNDASTITEALTVVIPFYSVNVNEVTTLVETVQMLLYNLPTPPPLHIRLEETNYAIVLRAR